MVLRFHTVWLKNPNSLNGFPIRKSSNRWTLMHWESTHLFRPVQPDAVLELNLIAVRLPGGTEKKEFTVALTANSQSISNVPRYPLFMVPGFCAMNSLLTRLHCWAAAGREVKGQLTRTRLPLTQHHSDGELRGWWEDGLCKPTGRDRSPEKSVLLTHPLGFSFAV